MGGVAVVLWREGWLCTTDFQLAPGPALLAACGIQSVRYDHVM